jgi:hypothetical protein
VKRFFIFWSFLALVGCASTATETAPVDLSGMPRRFISLRQVHPGMTRKEVASVLDTDIIIGYEMTGPDAAQYKPITMKNPYRAEDIEKNSHRYAVAYYLQGIKKADGQATDDELVPLVFENDRLLGMGWDFLKGKVGK